MSCKENTLYNRLNRPFKPLESFLIGLIIYNTNLTVSGVYGNFENPLFLAKDVAEWIDYAKTGDGYYNVNMMLKTVDETEKVTTNNIGSGGKSTFLTEDGLYEVLMQSRKPIAKQ